MMNRKTDPSDQWKYSAYECPGCGNRVWGRAWVGVDHKEYCEFCWLAEKDMDDYRCWNCHKDIIPPEEPRIWNAKNNHFYCQTCWGQNPWGHHPVVKDLDPLKVYTCFVCKTKQIKEDESHWVGAGKEVCDDCWNKPVEEFTQCKICDVEIRISNSFYKNGARFCGTCWGTIIAPPPPPAPSLAITATEVTPWYSGIDTKPIKSEPPKRVEITYEDIEIVVDTGIRKINLDDE